MYLWKLFLYLTDFNYFNFIYIFGDVENRPVIFRIKTSDGRNWEQGIFEHVYFEIITC